MSNENPTIESLDEATRLRLERVQARRAATAVAPAGSAAPRRGGAPTKRRHPSERARMGALALSLATTGGLTYLFASETAGAATSGTTTAAAGVVTAGSATGATAVSTATASTATAATAPTATAATTVTGSTATTPTAATASGTTAVNGATFTNKYGTMQVQAVFDSAGRLVSVNVLAFPDGDNKSVNINNRALPTLNSEAVTAQSATGVHSVSGATYTSTGYKQSLQSAIDAARAAGVTTLV